MPVVDLHRIDPGWHFATIEGYEYKKSTNGNPMLVVEMTLDDGQLIDVWFVVQYWGAGSGDPRGHLTLVALLKALGENEVAEELYRGHTPDYELDKILGRSIDAFINEQSQAIQFAPLHSKMFGSTE